MNDLPRQMSASYFMAVCQEGKTASVRAAVFSGAYEKVCTHALHSI